MNTQANAPSPLLPQNSVQKRGIFGNLQYKYLLHSTGNGERGRKEGREEEGREGRREGGKKGGREEGREGRREGGKKGGREEGREGRREGREGVTEGGEGG